ncbi:sensor histidine kinase [Phytomonospora endophytica]|uniref:histidine kinase n=1 Tax=Phytomonospora endophytica TaxID=714109 RepID=A0A841FDF6_9ACTN|nr:histidine kinase [Phytomonospora endophytica]MBB6034316.1 signal transduction histidine kinase [Phytomonospora endophytica]GIG66711.1 two-component sensor histidine kinase [Phytomonospora endophytica]
MTAAHHPWLAPPLDADGEGGPGPRTSRDWALDVGCLVVAAAVAVLALTGDLVSVPPAPGWAFAADAAGATAACAALWFRRGWPVPVGVVTVLASAVAPAAAIAAGVAMYTVALYRRFPLAAAVCALAVPAAAVRHLLRPVTFLPLTAWVLVNALAALTLLAWGMFARARRQLMLSLAERARRAEAEQRERAARVRRLERERIAREMHDVLAHRLSLLSLQAGALEYGSADAADSVSGAARVIRAGAHQALEDLRDVIVVLRDDHDEDAVTAQPRLTDVPTLVEESRSAGAEVRLDDRVIDAEAVPERAGRAVYQVVREALTNARKHAPGRPVAVVIDGSAGSGLTVEVRNPLPAPGAVTAIPGTGTGLVGLGERVLLAGGRLAHGPDDGDFRVHVWLPWPS